MNQLDSVFRIVLNYESVCEGTLRALPGSHLFYYLVIITIMFYVSNCSFRSRQVKAVKQLYQEISLDLSDQSILFIANSDPQ